MLFYWHFSTTRVLCCIFCVMFWHVILYYQNYNMAYCNIDSKLFWFGTIRKCPDVSTATHFQLMQIYNQYFELPLCIYAWNVSCDCLLWHSLMPTILADKWHVKSFTYSMYITSDRFLLLFFKLHQVNAF